MISVLLLTFVLGQPAPASPKASILLPSGEPVPSEVALGKLLVISGEKSERGPNTVSVLLTIGERTHLEKVRDGIIWIIDPPSFKAPDQMSVSKDRLTLSVATGLEPTTLKITQIVAKGEAADVQTISIKIGLGPRPPPEPPVPPKPPEPKPPTPASGLKVLIVRETGDAASIEPAFAQVVRKYLDEKASKAGWRIWDDDQVFSGTEPAILKEMFDKAKPFQSLPALILKNDKSDKATAMPLPKTIEALMAELKKWGG